MNKTTTIDGKEVIAVGAPGSIARAQCEGRPFGLKTYEVTEKESGWKMRVIANGIAQARSKAWVQGGWSKLPFNTCKKESFKVRELTEKETLNYE